MKNRNNLPQGAGMLRAAFSSAALLALALTSSADTIGVRPAASAPPPFLPDEKTAATPVEKSPARTAAPRTQALPPALKPLVPAAESPIQQTLAHSVLLDQPGDGRIWARGQNYKASFGVEGFTYVPFLGSDAPRAYPVAFTVGSMTVNGVPVAFNAAAVPSVQGMRVSFNRGAFTEVYDLAPSGIEQSFIITQPVSGELAFHVATATDLRPSAHGDRIEFANERGMVNYSQAIAVDARQTRTTLDTRLTAGGISIKVPAATVASAAWPLVVDPVISTVGVETGSILTRAADVAYEPSLNRYAISYVEEFSAVDHDVYSVLHNADGSQIAASTATIDVSTTNWANARTASKNDGDLFLTVAAVGAAPTRIIRGRTRAAGSTTVSAPIDISENFVGSGDKHSPDVGGDPFAGSGTFWLVVWQRDLSDADHDIHGRLVAGTATTSGGTIFIDNSGASVDDRPAISNSCGGTGLWMIAWDRAFTPTDHDIRGATVDFDGTITSPSFSIDGSGVDNTFASASSLVGTDTFLVAYNEGPSQIYSVFVDGATVAAGGNLTFIGGDPTGQAQQFPSVDTDGTKFMVTYSEQFSGSDWDAYIQAFCVNGSIISRAEGRRNLAFTGSDERAIRVASQFGGGDTSREGMAAWNTGGIAGSGDIQAALFTNPFACCPADIAPFGGNGVVNVDDLLAVINQWSFFCLGCEGDITGNLAINVDDLLAVINGWGNCP